MSHSIHDLFSCCRCRKIKFLNEGRRFRVPGRCHERRFVCTDCDTPRRRHHPEPSFLEQQIAQTLRRLHVLYEAERAFGRYRADFAIVQLGLVIEADGGRWHTGNRKKRDADKTRYIQSRRNRAVRKIGEETESFTWLVVRVTADDVDAQVEAAVHKRRLQLAAGRARRDEKREKQQQYAKLTFERSMKRYEQRLNEDVVSAPRPVAPPPARYKLPVYIPPALPVETPSSPPTLDPFLPAYADYVPPVPARSSFT